MTFTICDYYSQHVVDIYCILSFRIVHEEIGILRRLHSGSSETKLLRLAERYRRQSIL